MENFKKKLLEILSVLYPLNSEQNSHLCLQIEKRVHLARERITRKRKMLWSEHDVLLISYIDQIKSKKSSHLNALFSFMEKEMGDVVSGVHLLPFYPSGGDDGFSVIDYRSIEKENGTWNELKKTRFELMYDGVFNHVSAQSQYFKDWIEDPDTYAWFMSFTDEQKNKEEFLEEIKKVTRPRTHFVLTPFETQKGRRWCWTTFSEDQIDWDFSNPKVLLEILDILMFYYEEGASIIRVDAVPFFWKKLGTNCSHLPETHALLQLFRLTTDALEKNFILISESNVPHKENISYWGNGKDEAHLIYNFSLAPLILHANFFGKANYLHEWSKMCMPPNHETSFFNITATHDGIGVRPLEGIVPQEDLSHLADWAKERGGKVNYKSLPDGTQTPYELNITWSSFLWDYHKTDDENINKVVASHIASFSYPGLPGVYFHNLLGSFNWEEGVEMSGINRRINRQKFTEDEVNNLISPQSHGRKFLELLRDALAIRKKEKAFCPNSDKKDFSFDERVWSFARIPEEGRPVLIFYNISEELVDLSFGDEFNLKDPCDLLKSDLKIEKEKGQIKLSLLPHQIVWLCDKSNF